MDVKPYSHARSQGRIEKSGRPAGLHVSNRVQDLNQQEADQYR